MGPCHGCPPPSPDVQPLKSGLQTSSCLQLFLQNCPFGLHLLPHPTPFLGVLPVVPMLPTIGAPSHSDLSSAFPTSPVDMAIRIPCSPIHPHGAISLPPDVSPSLHHLLPPPGYTAALGGAASTSNFTCPVVASPPFPHSLPFCHC